MKTTDFDYELPEDLIAQHPLEERDHSRLLILDKETGERKHKHFYNILDELNEGDVLVLNKTRVIPARIYGKKVGGSAEIEVLLIKPVKGKKDFWEAMVRPGKRVKKGAKISFGDGLMIGTIEEETDVGRIISFSYEGIFNEILDQLGMMPLPPYIHEKLEDKNRYQTVYAKDDGSAAAPTAGLHFTPELLEKIKEKGIEIVEITLHVGIGTFKPVQVENINEHVMHSEYYEITPEAAEAINRAKDEGRRVFAVGTTSTRTLESAAKDGHVKAGANWTSIFIYPPYEWQIIDGLITNFHLPKSTLLMLVSALVGKENILAAYREAVEQRYRFFSFGDAMFIR